MKINLYVINLAEHGRVIVFEHACRDEMNTLFMTRDV